MLGFSSSITLIFMASALCALAYLAICAQPGKPWLKAVVKTASTGLLALIAFQISPYMLLAAALAACAVGDFFLTRDGTEEFISGIGAFAFGHLAYGALFLLHPSSDLHRISDGWPLALALVLLGAVMIAVLFRRAGALRWAVIFYVPIIVAMGILAMAVPPVLALSLILPGALLFVFSDFVLSQELFVLPEEHKARRYTPYVIWSTYYAAQVMLLLAFTATL